MITGSHDCSGPKVLCAGAPKVSDETGSRECKRTAGVDSGEMLVPGAADTHCYGFNIWDFSFFLLIEVGSHVTQAMLKLCVCV